MAPRCVVSCVLRRDADWLLMCPSMSSCRLQASGVDYEDMLFFDNERWNITGEPPHKPLLVYSTQGLAASAGSVGRAAITSLLAPGFGTGARGLLSDQVHMRVVVGHRRN